MIPLLVLRPQPGAAATAARAEALGLTAIVAPLFAIEPRAWAPPPTDRFDAVMLTSANALRHAGPALALYRALPAYAVGEATAAAARAAGFAKVHAAQGDAADLVSLLAGAGVSRVLHLCGTERREAVHPAVRIERIAVYRAVPVDTLPVEVRGALASHRHPGPFDFAQESLVPGSTAPQDQRFSDIPPGGCRNEPGMTAESEAQDRPTNLRAVALLHSPRAAATLAAFLDDAFRACMALAAISPAAAAAPGPGWRAVAVAAAPTDAALLAVATRLCEEAP